jgi:hypothetical protein
MFKYLPSGKEKKPRYSDVQRDSQLLNQQEKE